MYKKSTGPPTENPERHITPHSITESEEPEESVVYTLDSRLSSGVHFWDVRSIDRSYHVPSAHNVFFDFASKTETIDDDPSSEALIRRIESFRNYEEGWDGYGAQPFSDRVISIARWVARQEDITSFSPEVFPTGRGSIQFELINEHEKEVEFEIFDMENVIVLFIGDDEKMTEKKYSLTEALSRIHEFLR